MATLPGSHTSSDEDSPLWNAVGVSFVRESCVVAPETVFDLQTTFFKDLSF